MRCQLGCGYEQGDQKGDDGKNDESHALIICSKMLSSRSMFTDDAG
jgi:hypothetical protein